MVHSRTWCLRKPSHWNKNVSTHFLMWFQGTAWGVLAANLWPRRISFMRKLHYFSTKQLFYMGTFHASQPLLLIVKTPIEAVCLYSLGDTWRCLWAILIFTVVVLVVLLPSSGQRTRCCRLPPCNQVGPHGAFRGQTPPPWPRLAPCLQKSYSLPGLL